MYNIDVDVPIAESRVSSNRVRKYPFDELAVDESFFVSGKKRNAILTPIRFAEKRTGFSFVTRNYLDGVRVWRQS